MQNNGWPPGAFPISSDPIQLEGGRWRPRVVIKIKRAGQEVAERVYELPSVSFATREEAFRAGMSFACLVLEEELKESNE